MKKIITFIFLILLIWENTPQAQERPKIGLVFSGGGAKGFSQIPTLQLLDSLQFPIDFIAGTSMGGIIGALYAIGYSGLEIEKLVYQSDWQAIFTDKPPREMLPFSQKQLDGKYQLQFGIKGFKPEPQSGLIYGQKISLLFSELTFGYEKIESFDQLPIPFRCVAVNLVTGQEVHLRQGSLAKAMRATMSIPTYFSPVKWGDSLLVDGGLVNNLPIDVVQEMGATFVLAIDVGTKLKEQHELNSALSILQQTIAMQGREKWRKNIRQADLLVQPEVAEISSTDFSQEQIDKIFAAGRAAAARVRPQLVELKQKYALARLNNPQSLETTAPNTRIHSVQITGNTTIPFQAIYHRLGLFPGDIFNPHTFQRRLADLRTSGDFENVTYEVMHNPETVRILIRVRERSRPVIENIFFEGQKNFSEKQMLNLLAFSPGDSLDTDFLNQRIMEIYANGDFEHIHYFLDPVEKNKINLRFQVKELPVRRMNVGFKYNNQYQLLGAVRVKMSNVVPSWPGLNIDSEWQIAGLYRFLLKISHPYHFLGMPVYPFVKNYNQDVPVSIFDKSGHQIAKYRNKINDNSLGLGLTLKKSLNAEFELSYETTDFSPDIAMPDSLLFPGCLDSIGSSRLNLTIDQLDDALLPRNGFYFQSRLEGGFFAREADVKTEKFRTYFLFDYTLNVYKTIGQRHTFHLVHSQGRCSPETPVHKFLRNRSPETSIGFRFDQLLSRRQLTFRLDYRFQFRKNLFFSFLTNLVLDHTYRETFASPITRTAYPLFGIGVGVTYLTPVGPFQFIQSVGDKKFAGPREVQAVRYLSLGYKF